MTPTGIEPATFRFLAQHLNHCATAVPICRYYTFEIQKETALVGDTVDQHCLRVRDYGATTTGYLLFFKLISHITYKNYASFKTTIAAMYPAYLRYQGG